MWEKEQKQLVENAFHEKVEEKLEHWHRQIVAPPQLKFHEDPYSFRRSLIQV
jgi:hypothetical protein